MLAAAWGGYVDFFLRPKAAITGATLLSSWPLRGRGPFYPVLVRFFGLVRGRLDVARTPLLTGMNKPYLFLYKPRGFYFFDQRNIKKFRAKSIVFADS